MLLGGVFAAQFGMAAVYGVTEAGLSVGQISIFVASFYVAALLLQVSDRLAVGPDGSRVLIIADRVAGGLGGLVGMVRGCFRMLLWLAVLIGGLSNPLYSLLIAYTNDFLERRHGRRGRRDAVHQRVGAIAGPLVVAWMMDGMMGPMGIWLLSRSDVRDRDLCRSIA